MREGLYENLVILEIRKARFNRGKRPEMFFYRDTHGNEVDLVLRQARKLIPIEIKSAATFSADFLKGIDRFSAVAGNRCAQGFVLYNGNEKYTLKGTQVMDPIQHTGLKKLW